MNENRDLLIEARKAIRLGNYTLALSCIDLALQDENTTSLDKLLMGYEKLGATRPLVSEKKYGRRSAFDTRIPEEEA